MKKDKYPIIYEVFGIPSTMSLETKKKLKKAVLADITLLENAGFLIKGMSVIDKVVAYTVVKN
jgi:hypothetical protein